MDASTPTDAARTRTYTWDEPLAVAQQARQMKGLDFLRKIVSKEVPAPPIARTMFTFSSSVV